MCPGRFSSFTAGIFGRVVVSWAAGATASSLYYFFLSFSIHLTRLKKCWNIVIAVSIILFPFSLSLSLSVTLSHTQRTPHLSCNAITARGGARSCTQRTHPSEGILRQRKVLTGGYSTAAAAAAGLLSVVCSCCLYCQVSEERFCPLSAPCQEEQVVS